jgi:hypothetical protein
MAGSAGEGALTTRADSMRNAFERYGVTTIDSTTMLPLGAQAPLTAGDLALMVGAGFANGGGYGARPMTRTAFQQIGDVDVTARIRLFDGLADTTTTVAFRQTVGVVYRIGSGHHDQYDNFIDVGTGTGADGIGIRSFTDVRLRERVFATLTIGWLGSSAHTRALRVPWSTESAWLEDFTSLEVEVTPGSTIELGVAPRWQLSEHFLVGGEWRLRKKAADALSWGGMLDVSPFGIPHVPQPEALEAHSAWDETRLAWSISYSTLADVAAGRGRLPMEIGYTHEQTVSNSLGVVPQRFTDRIQLRVYTRLFGR